MTAGPSTASTLKAAVAALRDALADCADGPAFVFADGRYALHDTLRLRADVLEVLRAAQSGEHLVGAAHAAAGPFLPECGAAWAAETRTRALDAALTVHERLAAQADTPAAAAAWLRRALTLDPEAAHLRVQLKALSYAEGDVI